jgi:uncharacterized Zn ribbon protein
MTPLDVIKSLKGKGVVVQLKNGEEVEGRLVSFDLSSNIGIEVRGVLKFFQGESISTISTKR